MSAKYFCDSCDRELTKETKPTGGDIPGRLGGESHYAGRPTVSVMVGKRGGATNDGDFCKYCIIDAVNELDDRPTFAEVSSA